MPFTSLQDNCVKMRRSNLLEDRDFYPCRVCPQSISTFRGEAKVCRVCVWPTSGAWQRMGHHCGKRSSSGASHCLSFLWDADLCSLCLTLKESILAAHVVLDDLVAFISLSVCVCVWICVFGYGFSFVNSICLGEWGLYKGTCCKLHHSKDIERNRTYSTRGSHLTPWGDF